MTGEQQHPIRRFTKSLLNSCLKIAPYDADLLVAEWLSYQSCAMGR